MIIATIPAYDDKGARHTFMARSCPRGAVISLDGVELREAACALDALSAILSEAAKRGWHKGTAAKPDVIRNNLRRIRKSRSITQKELADRMGITQQVIGHWERGVRIPKTQSVHRLADALGVAPEELYAD